MAYAYPAHNAENFNQANVNKVLKGGISGMEDMQGWNNTDASYYCLDLVNKYHKDSKYKSFHMVTFYLRNSQGSSNLEKGYKNAIIRAQLPEMISYSIGGDWKAPFNMSIGNTAIGQVLTFASGESFENTADTTKIWTNTKPLQINLEIPIFDDSEDNSGINFQEVLSILGSAILPNRTRWNGTFNNTPGPLYGVAMNKGSNAGSDKDGTTNVQDYLNRMIGTKKGLDRITVQIGGMLLIDWAIITDMTVKYLNTKQQILHYWGSKKDKDNQETEFRRAQLLPQTAVLNLQIETVRGLTKLSYDNMLQLHADFNSKDENGDSYTMKQ